jgi:carbamoyl-phosphate synthase large subunit
LGGFTNFGEVIENKEIQELLIQIAERLQLTGSINIQLKLTPNGPVVFEINPRFSSTVLFRHLTGFKDLIWTLEDFFEMEISEYSPPPAGTKIYKGFMEFVRFNNKVSIYMGLDTVKNIS